jgi:hypothetical protein
MKYEKFKQILDEAWARRKASEDESETDYLDGYLRGLRKAYHGEAFGTDKDNAQWDSLSLKDDPKSQRLSQGYRDGQKAVLGSRKRLTASLTLPRKLLTRMELERQPGESRSAQAARLIMDGLKLTEKERREMFE